MEERPIDRGWAWMVCLGVAIDSMFLSGPLRSYGILFVEISRRFDSSGSVTSIVLMTISVGVAFTSPIAASLGEMYGQRSIVALGGILSFLGAFLTAFAPSVLYVCIIFGIFAGLGLGCIYAPAVVMIGYYFDKRRSLANGLGMAGGSIGQMTIPVLFTYLMEEYSFQGGMLIFSATLLHIVFAAMLMRPITYYKPINSEKKEPDKGDKSLNEEGLCDEEEKVAFVNGTAKNGEIVGLFKENDASHTKSLHNLSFKNKEGLLLEQSKADLGRSLPLLSKVANNGTENINRRTSSLYLLPNQTLTPANENGKEHNIHSQDNPEQIPKKKSLSKRFFIFFFKLYDWSLFKDKVWILYAISVATGLSGYSSTCLFLPPFAAEKGISPYFVSLLLTIAGGVTFVGRIGGGAFADLGLMKRSTLASICQIILGIAAFIQPFVPYYWAMCIFASVIGLIGGVFVAQTVGVVVELMGLKKMSASFGLSLMVSGLIQIPVPLIFGLLKDYTGTYDWSIFCCSLLLAAGAASLLCAGRLAEKRKSAPN